MTEPTMTATSGWCVILVASLSVACTPLSAKQDALVPQEKGALKGRSVVFVRRPLPTFNIYKSSDKLLQGVAGMFGLATIWGTTGAVSTVALSRSTAFLPEYQLTDPAYGVAAALGRSFGPHYGVAFAGLSNEVVETYDEREIGNSPTGRGDLALDLRTDYWGLASYYYGPNHRFAYRASMYLINTESGETVASGMCKYAMEFSEAKSLDEFTDTNAVLLKQEIKVAIESCAAELGNAILSDTARSGNSDR